MKRSRFIFSEIAKGKGVLRSYLNHRLLQETLRGKTIDIGGGKNADYIAFMPKTKDVDFVTFDVKSGATVNFETDRLPANDGAYDTVLFLNVMEHIYNYRHIASEVLRIVKPGGQIIGFVPFLMWYHADHRDFFRYTHEALQNIFTELGAKNLQIEVVGQGPFVAAAHMVLFSFPRFIQPVIFFSFAVLDYVYRKLKGTKARPYALGYLFKITK